MSDFEYLSNISMGQHLPLKSFRINAIRARNWPGSPWSFYP